MRFALKSVLFVLFVLVFFLAGSVDESCLAEDSVIIPDSPCNSDCTTYDGICHPECDGINGCVYPPTSFLSDDMLTIKEVCSLQKKGWLKSFNSTHNILCCNGLPIPKLISTKLTISVDPTVNDIVTYSRYINYNGKMVTMYISVWE